MDFCNAAGMALVFTSGKQLFFVERATLLVPCE